MTDLNFLANRT